MATWRANARAAPRRRWSRARPGRRACRDCRQRRCGHRSRPRPADGKLGRAAEARFSPIVPTASLIVSVTDLSEPGYFAAGDDLSLCRRTPARPWRRCERSPGKLVAGDEIGFGIDLDHGRLAQARIDADQAFGRGAAGLLVGLGDALLAQPVDRGLHVAAGLGRAALQSIMPAPVSSRSSLTCAAEMLIVSPLCLEMRRRTIRSDDAPAALMRAELLGVRRPRAALQVRLAA